MVTVKQVYDELNKFAPFENKAPWDNIGLLTGSFEHQVSKAVVTLDVDRAAIDRAIETDSTLIISHHPAFFDGLKRITEGPGYEGLAYKLVSHNIDVISAHTNLDAAEGGINDCLADILGMNNPRPFLEDGVMLGRFGKVNFKDVYDYIRTIKQKLNAPVVRYILNKEKIEKVASVCGSGSSGLYAAHTLGCDTLITGDCKYSTFKTAEVLGMNLLDFGHFETEYIIIKPLIEKLKSAFSQLDFYSGASESAVKII